jgi:hypothetical protein
MQRIIENILNSRICVIKGTKGMGKTAIAIAVGHYLTARRHCHCLFVDISTATDLEDIEIAITSLCPRDRSPSNPDKAPRLPDRVSAALERFKSGSGVSFNPADRGRPLLVILDHADTILASNAALFRQFLSDLAKHKILITCRRSLGRVPLCSPQVTTIKQLTPVDSLRLFCAMSPRSDAEIPGGRPDTIARSPLFVQLGGNPMAITHAALLLEDRTFSEAQRLVLDPSAHLNDHLGEDTIEVLKAIREFAEPPPRGDGPSLPRRAGSTDHDMDAKHRLTSALTETVYREPQRRDSSWLDQADALRSLASVHLQLDNLDSSLKHLNDAIALYRKCEDPIGEADTTAVRTGMKMEHDRVDSTDIHDLEHVVSIYRLQNDLIGEAWALKMIAEVKLMLILERKEKNQSIVGELNAAHQDVQRSLTVLFFSYF